MTLFNRPMIYLRLMKKRKIEALTDSELKALEERYRMSEHNHIRERCKCILMSNSGYDVANLCDFFGVFRHTIYGWFDRWESAVIDGFANKSGQGRKPTLDVTNTEQFEIIEKTVALHPQNLSGAAVEVTKSLGIPVTKRKLKSYLKKRCIAGNE